MLQQLVVEGEHTLERPPFVRAGQVVCQNINDAMANRAEGVGQRDIQSACKHRKSEQQISASESIVRKRCSRAAGFPRAMQLAGCKLKRTCQSDGHAHHHHREGGDGAAERHPSVAGSWGDLAIDRVQAACKPRCANSGRGLGRAV